MQTGSQNNHNPGRVSLLGKRSCRRDFQLCLYSVRLSGSTNLPIRLAFPLYATQIFARACPGSLRGDWFNNTEKFFFPLLSFLILFYLAIAAIINK